MHKMQVEVKTTAQTPNPDLLQKAADFVHAFLLGELCIRIVHNS
jgi:rRNA processing protein Krr1/Pno1